MGITSQTSQVEVNTVNGKFKDWLTAQMEEAGLSQSELAQRAGLSPSNISMVLSGDKGAGVDFILKIAWALHLRPGYVFEKYATETPLSPQQEGVASRVGELVRQLFDQDRADLAGLIYDFAQMIRDRASQANPASLEELPLDRPVVDDEDLMGLIKRLDSYSLRVACDFLRWLAEDQAQRRNSSGERREPEEEGFYIPPFLEGADLAPEQIEQLKAVHHRLANYIESINPVEREAYLNETAAVQLRMLEEASRQPDQPAEEGDPANEGKTAINNR